MFQAGMPKMLVVKRFRMTYSMTSAESTDDCTMTECGSHIIVLPPWLN